MTRSEREQQLCIHIICKSCTKIKIQNIERRNSCINDSWQGRLNSSSCDNSIRIEHGAKRWETIKRIENIIIGVMPKKYVSDYRNQLLDVSWLLENTIHACAPTYKDYSCDGDDGKLEQKVLSITRGYAVRIVAKDASFLRYRHIFRLMKSQLIIGSSALAA